MDHSNMWATSLGGSPPPISSSQSMQSATSYFDPQYSDDTFTGYQRTFQNPPLQTLANPEDLVPFQLNNAYQLMGNQTPTGPPMTVPSQPGAVPQTYGGTVATMAQQMASRGRKRRNRNPDKEDKWEKHRETIIRLYVDEETCLDEVMSYMREKHNFRACEQAYKQTLRRWEVGKNIPSSAMSFMVAKAATRKMELGKETVFYWHDRPVPAKKLERFKRRTSQGGDPKSAAAAASGGTSPLQSHLLPNLSLQTATPLHTRFATPEPVIARFAPTGHLSPTSPQSAMTPTALKRRSTPNTPPVSFPVPEWADDGFQVLESKFREPRSKAVDNVLSEGYSEEREDNANEALKQYRELLANWSERNADGHAIIAALRGVVRILRDYDEIEDAVHELERLVAGLFCLVGPGNDLYLSQALKLVVIYISSGRVKDHGHLIKTVIHGFSSSTAPLDERACDDLIWVAGEYMAIEKAEYVAIAPLFARVLDQLQKHGLATKAVAVRLNIVDMLQEESWFVPAGRHLSSALDFCSSRGGGEALFSVNADINHGESILGSLLDCLERQFSDPSSTGLEFEPQIILAKLSGLKDTVQTFRHQAPNFNPSDLKYWFRLARVHSKLHSWDEISSMLAVAPLSSIPPPAAVAHELKDVYKDIYWEVRTLAESCWHATNWATTVFALQISTSIAESWWGVNSDEYKSSALAQKIADNHSPPRFYKAYPGMPRLTPEPSQQQQQQQIPPQTQYTKHHTMP